MLQHFEPEICYLPPTYIFTTSKITGTINNDDNKIFKYEWRLYSSKEEEEQAMQNIDAYSPEGRNSFHSLLLFHTDALSIEPISGEIWSKLHQQFVITFNPQIPDNFKQIAYLYNLDTEERIPYEINANALQPSAAFSVSQINTMHVPLDETRIYSINFINTGKVPFDFELIKRTLPHLQFKFSPSSGHIGAGETIPIQISFSANYVGQFNEVFQYRIVGYEDSCPSITIFGRVIGPSFSLDRNFIDFGNVSYGFLYSQEFEITNTSDIPFEYLLRMKQDKNFDAREFCINPNTGVVPKRSKRKICVEFIPIFVQDYEVTILIESTKFEETLGTIKLIGKCLCPYITIENEVIDLGEVFINHDYITNVNLVDDTDFPAKFEFIEIEDKASHDMQLNFLKYKGSISSHSKSSLPIRVTPKQLGPLEIQRSIRIFGSDFPPIPFTIRAMCTGPNILFPSNLIDFGSTPVFEETTKIFPITNDSLIPAVFNFDLKNENQLFSIEPENGEIEPGETLNLNVTANLDDSITYNSKLIMNIKYLNPITLDIKARGTGTAIISSIDMDYIDMGFVFTMKPAVINFTLTNRGRRTQELKWSFMKPKIEGNSKAQLSTKIQPEAANIGPKETIQFQFIFESNLQCAFSIVPVCQSTIGKQRIDLYKPEIKGIFIKPMLSFESTSLTFKYVHNVDEEEKLTGNLKSNELIVPSQSLLKPIVLTDSITNNSELPLQVEAHCEKPFNISQTSFFLQPREVVPFDLIFYTDYKQNFTSETLDRKVQFIFKDNPHKYIIHLKGLMIFPNLSFSQMSVNFGILLKGTEETRIIKAKNESDVPVRFYWELKNKQSFDIYPISDSVEPGETKDVHITFYADEGKDFTNTAVCHVIGGPEYPIELIGSSSCTDYTLDHKKIDFGKRDYMELLSDSILLTNKSTAPINYCIKLPKGLKFQMFSIEPQKGVLHYNKSVTFNFKLIAGLPRSYDGKFIIQIGNFDEVQFDIHVDCYIPQIIFNVPRLNSNEPKPVLKNEQSSNSESESDSDGSSKLSQIEEILNKTTDKKNSEKEIQTKALIDERKYMIEQFTAVNKRPRKNHNKLGTVINFKGVVLQSYAIDFGELILGDNKTINCDLMNATPYPISFDLLANSLTGTGFSINTTSFRDIPPNEIINLVFQFESDKRTHGLGKHDLEIPLIFDSELGYMIHILSDIKMPLLTFSKTNFVFEPTIVGQKWTQTFQVQNLNPIPVTFSIDECQNVNILQKSNPPKSSTFIAYPTSATLPPYSFLNIDITFSPTGDREYMMQFPVNIKYSDQVFLQVKGQGIMMKLFFDPPEINFDSIQPFTEKSVATVDLVNKSLIDIEVYSQQFDFQIFCNQLTKQFMELKNPSEEMLMTTFSNPVNHEIFKFSQVIIVHGPPKSGKTTVCRKLSEMLEIPIVNLKELWSSDKQDLSDDELLNIFKENTSDTKYLKGFIVDGLDTLPDNSPENEQFIMHFLKQKSTLDELSKNPYTILNDPIITTTEKMMNLLISALDGQYLFFIGLNANEIICHNHESENENEEKLAKISKLQQEMDDLFNMDEETYMKLTEEEQMIVDEKREHFRKYKIEHNGDFSEYNPLVEDEKIKAHKESHGKARKQKVPRGQVPSDPILQSVILFQYTFGRLSEKVRNKSSNFRNLFTLNENDEKENIHPQPEKEKEKEKEKDRKKKDKEVEVLKSIANSNCLIVNSFESIDCVMNEISSFLPSKEKFAETASSIPQPRKQLPDSSNIKLSDRPELFAIVNEESPGEFPEILRPIPHSSQQKKRNKLSSTAKEPISILPDPNILDDVDVMSYTPRWKIPPNSRVTLKLSFDSISAGSFSDNLLFGIANCRNDVYKLPVSGICYYADIDRSTESIFPKIIINLPKANKVQNAFLLSTNEFYFGALLIQKDRTRNSPLAYKASLNFVNNSEFPVETFCDLKISGVKTPWALENPNQVIKPGETGNLIIGFNPTSAEVYRNKLTVMIKDNPEPIYINLLGEGCSPTCEISTTSLDFDKLLLNMSRTLSFTIKNSGKIPAFWKIKGGNVLGNAFTISAMEGTLGEKASVTVTITFSSERSYNAKKVLQIDVFDVKKTRIFMSHHLSVTAESFDVLFDFIYPKGLDHLNFGVVKVGEEKVLQCLLKNKGKYPNKYQINLNNNFSHPNYLHISPNEGEVSPGEKGVFVNVSFKAESSKKFNNCKAIMLTVSDPINNKVTSSISLPFSVETVYSSFSLDPNSVLDFGPVPVSTTMTKTVVLKNNGVFPFDFEVFPKIEINEPKYPTTKNGKPRKQQQLKKNNNQRNGSVGKGKKKGNGKDFAIDHFHVNQSAGNLVPDSDTTFSVSFNSNVDGVFENTIIYKISDCVPKLREGIPFNLRATVFIPGILTDDFEKIFPNQLLCLRYDILKNDTAAFIEDEQIYHFSPVVLNQSTKVEIDLINPLPIPCTVDVSIKPRQKTPSQKFPFELTDKMVNINANSTSKVQVSFSPNSIDLFKGVFEATVRGGLNPKTKTLKFGIEGQGTLPSVTIIDPPNNNTVLYGKTLVNNAKNKTIVIQNNGIVPATLTLTTTSETPDDFHIENSPKTIVLGVKQSRSITVKFCPLSVQKSQMSLTIDVLDNPESNISLDFIGEGFHQDVFFEGIKGDENELYFNNVVGQRQQISFMMRNVCKDNVRFQWSNHSDFTFLPRIGHLHRGECKNITVTYYSEKPSKSTGITMKCQWSKIKITESEEVDWDDSMKVIKFVDRSSLNPHTLKPPPGDERPKGTARRFPGAGRRNSTMKRTSTATSRMTSRMSRTVKQNDENNNNKLKTDSNPYGNELIKVVEVKPEPAYKTINGKQKDLQLRIFAVSDFIKYSISTDEIEFPATMMFEKRSVEFTMTNTSQIRFNYDWAAKQFGAIKTNYASSYNCPFSVEPSTGSLDAGESTTFVANFVPEEVDEFSAHLVCEIPFLTQMNPPDIRVTGRSRRPVCHFYLETSDYLTANRRHPDYTDPLPNDVRVVEICASKLKKLYTKKFGILNTTDTPYEVTWERIDKNDDDNCPIFCSYPKALISSGKQHVAQFSYRAVSVKTVESLWLFSIPDYNIHITFLFVGKMIPH